MTFALTPAAPFTAGVSTISAATANTWRTNISQSLDTVNGGAYVNVSTIDWSAGGAGWRFYAALAIKSTGTLTLDAGATVTINADPSLFGTLRVGIGAAGGGVRFYATSTLTVDDTVAMSLAGDATWTSASTSTFAAGSTLAINTALATLGQDSVLTINGASGHVAQVIYGQYSTCTYLSESGVTCNSGAIFTLGSGCFVTATIGGGGNAGSLTFGADATLTVPTTCTTSMAIGADGTLSTAAGASVVMSVGGGGTTGSVTFNANGTLETTASSTITMGGTTTRTGPEILSGNTAYRALRVFQLNDPPGTIDARQYDILECLTLAADATLTLSDLAATEKVQIMVFYAGLAGVLTVAGATDGTLDTLNAVAPGESRMFYWSGSHWRAGV